MRKIITIFVLLAIAVPAFSQNGSVKGIAFDTSRRQPVPSATITIMKKKDSSLLTFSMADNSGRFELTDIPNGEYRLLLTQVNYRNGIKYFTIDNEHKTIDLGNIPMNDKNKVLDEVVVEAPPVTLI